MKKYFFLLICLTAIISSCKKENDTVKDYAVYVNDKTWTGEMINPGDSIEFYSVHFKADKTLLWSQFSADYSGNWGLNGKQVVITLDGLNTVIRADMTSDGRMSNITVANSFYRINNARLLTNPDMPLEGSVWKGSGFFAVATYPYQMSFLPGAKVEVKIQNTTYPLYTYSRAAAGGAIRFTGFGGLKYFGVFMSDNEIEGCVSTTNDPWHTIKQ